MVCWYSKRRNGIGHRGKSYFWEGQTEETIRRSQKKECKVICGQDVGVDEGKKKTQMVQWPGEYAIDGGPRQDQGRRVEVINSETGMRKEMPDSGGEVSRTRTSRTKKVRT